MSPRITLALSAPMPLAPAAPCPRYLTPCPFPLLRVRDMPDGSARWIIKPSITNQAAGIAVIDSCAGLRRCLESAPDLKEWVAQRYVERPLLIRGRKFHLRAYVLCVGRPHHWGAPLLPVSRLQRSVPRVELARACQHFRRIST